jgi:predicted oxidoreductase
MYKIQLGKSGLSVPTMAVGCMRISNMAEKDVSALVDTALSSEVNFFDHADIYGDGGSEVVFGKVISSISRESIIIQDKCGIVPGKMYDFSYEHIISSVDGSLKRLNTDYIDVLLLHRPDALFEPEEVAKAFDRLKTSGKVRHFGVSNQNPYQIALLQKHLDMPVCANQMQFGIMHMPSVQSGMNFNMMNEYGVDRDGGVIDYCRLNDITIQTWSSLQYGFFEGCFVDNDRFPELNRVLSELAEKYSVSKTTIAIAWILRHPARMQPVTGTTNPERLKECFRAADVTLTREEWYKVYLATGSFLP